MMYNDYELVYYAQEHNEYAYEILYNKYYKLIYSISLNSYKKLKCSFIEFSDVFIEAQIAFYQAVMQYNQDNDALFFTFANLCIERKLNNYIYNSFRAKHFIDDSILLEEISEISHPNLSIKSVEENYIDSVSAEEMYKKIKDVLNFNENIVLDLKVQGFNYKEISNILDINIDKIYSIIKSVRKKAKISLSM